MELYTVYKLSCEFTDLVYIGKTKQKLNVRRNDHETAFRNRETSYNNRAVDIILAIAQIHKVCVVITPLEEPTDKQNAVELELGYIEFYKYTNRCVNIRYPRPDQCGTGSRGTKEYRCAKHKEKKQKLFASYKDEEDD